MLQRSRSLLLLALILALVACSSSGGTGGRSTSNSGRNSGDRVSSGFPDAPESNSQPSRGDRRVIFYQAKNSVAMILVNRGHSGLKSEQGRLNIALGNPHQSFKALDEDAMESLLKNLGAKGFDAGSSEFVRGDERYFDPRADGSDGYRGIFYVEDNGRRSKMLGLRPQGFNDVQGQRRYQDFSDLKTILLIYWDGVSKSEMPSSDSVSPR